MVVGRSMLLCFLRLFFPAAMKCEVGPSSFEVGSIGVPPPKTRRLVFMFRFCCGNEPQEGSLHPAQDRRGVLVPETSCPDPGLVDQPHSARKLEDEESQQLARAWVVCAQCPWLPFAVVQSRRWSQADLNRLGFGLVRRALLPASFQAIAQQLCVEQMQAL